MLVSPAKTAQPIEMPFGLWTRVGPGNHVLDHRWGPDPPRWEGAIMRDNRDTAVSCAKTAETIQFPFGLWAWMGPRNHVLDGSPEVLRDAAKVESSSSHLATIHGLKSWRLLCPFLGGELGPHLTQCIRDQGLPP